MKNFNKEKEIIYAGAIGDAFGYLIEFDYWEQIQEKYGTNGLQYNQFINLSYRVSDDTQMTLFCWNAILNKLKNHSVMDITLEEINSEIYQQYLNWYLTQDRKKYNQNHKDLLMKYKEIWRAEAPGHTCLSALGSGRMGKIEKHINNSKGCGGIMRVAPISFLPFNNEEIFKLGCMQAAITHGHPDGYLSAGFFASILKSLMENNSFEKSYNLSLNILKKYSESQELINYLENIMSHIEKEVVLRHNNLTNEIGLGWVGEEALGIALYALLKAKSFEDLLDISANHSGDSDSTASLAAQLYVAQNGLEEKYKDIFNRINVAPAINYLVEKKMNINKQNNLTETIQKKNKNHTDKVSAQNNFQLGFIKNLFSTKKKK